MAASVLGTVCVALCDAITSKKKRKCVVFWHAVHVFPL